MNRVVVGVIILIILIISVGIYTQNYLTSSSEHLVSSLYTLDKNIRAKQWAQAKAEQIKLENDWERVKPKWAIVINHHEIDNIDVALAQFKSYIETTEDGDALSKVSELILLFNHIPDKEKVAVKNVL